MSIWKIKNIVKLEIIVTMLRHTEVLHIEEITKNGFYILKFIESTRFMASSLSNVVNNLSEEIHRIKCKYGHDDKKVKLVEMNTSIATVFLNIQTLKMI